MRGRAAEGFFCVIYSGSFNLSPFGRFFSVVPQRKLLDTRTRGTAMLDQRARLDPLIDLP